MSYSIGSLFDGSGGFPLAGTLCGIEPRWASEVEPYPIAVTRSRFPNMKHLGDISKINGAEIEPVDVISFGSPCQDLSVGGRQTGIKHEKNGDEKTTRSGLFVEAARIIQEMRRATNDKYPKFAIWENVPGAFSSNNGEDFRTVLQEIIQIVEPSAPAIPTPEKGGWPYADVLVGDGWSVAYRVFDTQHWPRTPQRRQRIYLVADFTGNHAEKVLFEREGLRGNYAENGIPWQVHPSGAEGGAGAEGQGYEIGRTYIMSQIGGQGERCRESPVSSTLCAGGNAAVAYGICSYESNSMRSDNPHSGIYKAETSRTIDLNGGNPACNQGGLAIVKDFIVRRLTPTECARLQGFPDWWGYVEPKDTLTESECLFWQEVRNTHASINGKTVKEYTERQMLSWYNKLHSDSAEYKMWGNGLALPPTLYVMQGIADALNEKTAAKQKKQK